MRVWEPVRSNGGAAGAQGLSGLELQHDFHLLLSDWAAWNVVADVFKDAGADVSKLHLARQGNEFIARCRLKRLNSDEARALSNRLVADGLAAQSSVEHLMLATCAPEERAP